MRSCSDWADFPGGMFQRTKPGNEWGRCYSTPVDTSDFHATVNGVAWEATETDRSAILAGGVTIINGISADNKVITIQLNDTIVGTYTVDSTAASLAAFVDNNSSNTFPYSTNQSSNTGLAGGTIIVTTIDKTNKTISGSFQYNAYRLLTSRWYKLLQVYLQIFPIRKPCRRPTRAIPFMRIPALCFLLRHRSMAISRVGRSLWKGFPSMELQPLA